MLHRFVFASFVFLGTAATVLACVGDDPTGTSPPAANDGGGGTSDSATTTPGDDGGTPATDGGPCDLSADFTEIELVASLSGAATEGAVTLSQDEREAIISSLRNETAPDGGYENSDLFLASRADLGSTFGEPSKSLLAAVNADGKLDSDPTLSPNGLLLIWTQRMREGGVEHVLHYAERSSASDAFEPRGPLAFGDGGGPKVGSYPKGTFLLPNGTLYFVSLASDYYVYRAAPLGLGKFTAPVEQTFTGGQHIVADAIVVAPDEKTMYIGSSAAGGDIAVLTRAKADDPWGPARVLSKISSASWDQPRWLSPDGCRLYVTSGRSGDGDVFVARRK